MVCTNASSITEAPLIAGDLLQLVHAISSISRAFCAHSPRSR